MKNTFMLLCLVFACHVGFTGLSSKVGKQYMNMLIPQTLEVMIADVNKGVHFCLFGNLWGTNFSMWWEGSIPYRFKIAIINRDVQQYGCNLAGRPAKSATRCANLSTCSVRADASC